MEIGKEGLRFENGAFTYYGVSALAAPSSGKPGPLWGLWSRWAELPLTLGMLASLEPVSLSHEGLPV